MKFIYLDEWCWIDINNIAQRRRQDKDYSDFITLSKKNIKEEIWAFPLSLWHLSETKNTGGNDKRSSLAKIQQEFSNDWYISSFNYIREKELQYVTEERVLKQSNVIKHELSNVFGTTHKEIVNAVLLQEGISDEGTRDYINSLYLRTNQSFISLAEEYENIDELKKHGLTHLKSLKALDKKKKLTECEILLINFKDYYNIHQQELILKKLLVQISELNKEDSREETIRFFKNFPSFYTSSMLLYETVRSKSDNSLHRNDFLDIVFLSVAIPYCDIVITEKQWKRQAEKQSLGDIFDTNILDNVKDICG